MKRLICAADVMDAAARGSELAVDDNTIVTAQARDVAREHGVKLVFGVPAASKAASAAAPAGAPAADRAAASTGAPASPAGGRETAAGPCPVLYQAREQEPVLSAEEMERVIGVAIDRGVWTEGQLAELLGSVAGPAAGASAGATAPTAPVGVSGRHIHLSQRDLEALFGAGHELTPIKQLSQPGQFAAKETVTLAGPKGVIERVRVLGPVRPQTQVEILAGDSFKLGVPAVVRLSGDLAGTPGVTVVGPAGSVALDCGVMVAARHIHLSCAEAAERGLHDGQTVSIVADGPRGGRLDNVIVRANDASALDCHLDTEEANALGLGNGSIVRIVAHT